MSVIASGSTEPISVFIVDSNGEPLAGLADIAIRIRRTSDGQFLDWTGFPSTTFSAAPAALNSPALAEASAANSPGLYELTGGLDMSAITNSVADDTLTVITVQTTLANAKLPAPESFLVGGWVDVAQGLYDSPIGEAIYIDPQVSNVGTVLFTDGTKGNPVQTEAAARVLADALGVRRYFITNFGPVTLTQATFDFTIASNYSAASLDLNGQDAAGSRCVNLNISGTNASSFAFSNFWVDCFFKNAFGLDGFFENCIFDPGIGFTSGATLISCSSFDDSVLVIDMGGASTFLLRVFDWSGRLAISNMNAASSKVDIECHGGAQVRLDADVLQLGAGIRIGGTFALDNQSLLTPDLSGRVAEVVDEVLSTVHGSGFWDSALGGGLTAEQAIQLQETWTSLGLNVAGAPASFDFAGGFVRALGNVTPIDIAITVVGTTVILTRQP